MGFLHRQHRCEMPKEGNLGDVWQCDSCLLIYRKNFLFGWLPMNGELLIYPKLHIVTNGVAIPKHAEDREPVQYPAE